MKSNLLRILAVIMAVVMITCSFAACSFGGNEDPNPTKPDNVEGPVGDDDNLFDDDENNDNAFFDDETDTTTQAPETTTQAPETTTQASSDDNSADSDFVVDDEDSESDDSAGDSSGDASGVLGNVSGDDVIGVLNAAGYEYDAEQKIYYSTLNPWQRHFGFGDEYDIAAAYTNMRYTTLKIDFAYDGLLWRLQWWKGQYGALEGAEMGVYTKDPNDTSTTFYDCADNDHLLKMSFEYYRTVDDYNKKNMLFEREEQKHWWLTGFKFGYTVGSDKSVLKGTIEAEDDIMADGIEAGLKAVTDNKGKWNGFIESGTGTGRNYYVRNGNKFTVLWIDAGYENYQTGPISPNA